MFPLLVGVIILVSLMMIARWVAVAPPTTVLRTAKWTGAALLVGGGALLLATGRLSWALAALAALVPWLVRLLQLHNVFRAVRSGFARVSRGRAQPGRSSSVETRFLRMVLDHDSGRLSGEILDGPYRGRQLSQLAFDQAMDLHRQCAADLQSIQVLEAWLERTWPDWRQAASAEPPRGAGSAGMDRKEAYAVLGLEAGASAEEIKAAYHKLMGRVHPDHGGSNYLAAKLNQAKALLLDD